jgi:hypothetical protein
VALRLGHQHVAGRCHLDWCVSPTDRVIKEGTIGKVGLELVETVTWPARPTDLTSEVLRLKQANPDFIWPPKALIAHSVTSTAPSVATSFAMATSMMHSAWRCSKGVAQSANGRAAGSCRGSRRGRSPA